MMNKLMSPKEMFEQAMKRPKNYAKLSRAEQWRIDKELNILDWDGSCEHSKGYPCKECEERYFNR